jgi:PAS domain S-box-containing protein
MGCETLETVSAAQDYTLSLADSIPRLLALAEELTPGLILLDAGPDNPEAARQIRAHPSLGSVPIIVSASRNDHDLRSRSLEAGADDFVSKPYNEFALQARLGLITRLDYHRRRPVDGSRLWQEEAKAAMGKREHQLTSLQSVCAAITSSLDLESVLNILTREMANLLEMKACIIWKWEQKTNTLHLRTRYDPSGWWSDNSSLETYHLADSPSAERVLVERRAHQASFSQSTSAPTEPAHIRGRGITSLLRLPMIFQDRVMGLVEIMDNQRQHKLPEEEVALAQLLANQAASAIENARLYHTIHRQVTEATTLHEINQIITSILDLHETLSIIAEHAHWLLDVAAASVILYDEDNEELWFGAACGEGADFVRGKRLEAGKGIVNWVIAHSEPVIVPDVSKDPRFFGDWDKEIGFTTRSILSVPLRTKGKTIGAIEAINKARGPFDSEDLNLLISMASAAAIAIENARLYTQAQQEIAERKRVEARLLRVNQALRTLGACHETLVRAEDQSGLLSEVCRILVEVGGHRLAWVGFAEQDEGKHIRRLAHAGHDEGYLAAINPTWADTVQGNTPAGTAIRTRELCLVEDLQIDPGSTPWRTEASKRNFASVMSLPLAISGQSTGSLTIYSEQPDAFNPEVVELLKQLANDLAFGIVALRTRTERDRAEEQIRRLYQELQDRANSLEATVAERTCELQGERDRNRAILEALGEAVIVIDLRGKIQYLNPAAVELTGYTPEEAAGRSPMLWPHAQQSFEFYGQEQEGTDATRAQYAEVVSRRKDGTLYDAVMTVAPLFDSYEVNRLVGHVCVQRDITPIKEAERLKDQFISNVSHELRTPLSVITLVSGNLDRLYDRLDDDRRRKMIQDIRKHAQALNDLIGGVLEISRIESGQVSTERQYLDLGQLVREEVEKQHPLADKKLQKLHVSSAEGLSVWGHEDQLRQVISNLLNNAIKYTPDHGHITCECLALAGNMFSDTDWPGSSNLSSGHWAALRVADSGIGISKEDLPHLFERFYRVKTQGNIPGTGLGLSIAQELIKLHGGQIAATSTPEEGSIFAIYLPLTEV